MAKVGLTTIDNPYDVFNDFKHWFLFDVEKGYNSSGYLARIVQTNDSLTDKENDEELERAIDEIVDLDVTGMYIKVRNPNEK